MKLVKTKRLLREPRRLIGFIAMPVFLLQSTWVQAGTTGGIAGKVTNDHGAAVAGAIVQAASPSDSVSTTTDATGHFTFLTLAPDTYTLTASRLGYNKASVAGIVVFADQTLTVTIAIASASLRTIAHVVSQSSGSLVRPGTTVDVYSVNASTATQLATSAGGNNLDSAYSTIYQQPGVLGLPGNYGFGQVFFIHGSTYDQIGYEFDGVPVNRAFDNYNASSLSNLGTQSTEVYTGGGPADATSPTLGGYVNQVIKTGTFPSYTQLSGGIGTPAYYHQATVEAGGATPDRLFSWYVGIRGSHMLPNEFNDSNGANLNPNGDNPYGQQGFIENALLFPAATFGLTAAFDGIETRGPWSECLDSGRVAPANGSYLSPILAGLYGVSGKLNACNVYSPLAATGTYVLGGNDLSDRENVLNFHIAVPHRRDGGHDDVQILYDNFYYLTQSWDNTSTFGGLPYFQSMFANVANANGTGLYNTFLNNLFGTSGSVNFLGPAGMPQYAGFCATFNLYYLFGASPRCASTGYSPVPYFDATQIVNAQFGQSALNSRNIVAPYYFPGSPQDRPYGSGMSPYQVSSMRNNGSIFKVQYTRNFSSNAYVRLFGYSFYSDWLMNDPNLNSVGPFLVGGSTTPDYDLNTHTRGMYLQLADQVNAQHLLSVTSSYTTASSLRWNNRQFTFTPTGTPIATLIKGGRCYSAYANKQGNAYIDPAYGNIPAGTPVSCLSALAGAPIAAVQAGSCANSGAQIFSCVPATQSGASWLLTQNLAPDGNLSTVAPQFFDAAIQDDFRPTDKWNISAGIRYESYNYILGDFSSQEQALWFDQINATACVNPADLSLPPASHLDNGQYRFFLVPSGYIAYITTAPGARCPYDPILKAKLYHPGQHGVPQITLGGTGTIGNQTWSPRVGFTYAASPDAVFRFSYGRYTQPTNSSYEQVLTFPDGYQMATHLINSAYYRNGFNSVVHDNPIQFSNNWDASYEQHFKGTDVSIKLSPFYRLTSNQTVQVPSLSGGFNTGTAKNTGVEFALQKGDASRNGLSGQLSYTYTYSLVKFGLINGVNSITAMLGALEPLESLEKINGGAPCYYQGQGVADCHKAQKIGGTLVTPSAYVYNPYYNFTYTNAELASEYPVNAYYPQYLSTFPDALQAGNVSTVIPPNVFSGFLSYKHDRLQATLTGNLWQGTQYGAPTDIAGLDPRSCIANQGQISILRGSQYGDYQTCTSAISVPNPVTGRLAAIDQYRNPWELNLGAQIAYDVTPRIKASILLANIGQWCFGGSSQSWTAAFPPNNIVCAYGYNTAYDGWTQGEKYNTAGGGFYYGNGPHSSLNGTTGYPKIFDQPYSPLTSWIAAPFQAYFTVNVRL